jgi:hypothetical protein
MRARSAGENSVGMVANSETVNVMRPACDEAVCSSAMCIRVQMADGPDNNFRSGSHAEFVQDVRNVWRSAVATAITRILAISRLD